ncbi:hypothetical protein BDR04DRAFT_47837 [Suillus decipiens]|nr:hypothetical protein BDR04DRAFT_47837 [Suillus decipiens]
MHRENFGMPDEYIVFPVLCCIFIWCCICLRSESEPQKCLSIQITSPHYLRALFYSLILALNPSLVSLRNTELVATGHAFNQMRKGSLNEYRCQCR